MRDMSHSEEVKGWAVFVKNNPATWKAIHSKFIDAQFEKSKNFYKRLMKTDKGKEKIIKIFKIKNTDILARLK